MWKSLGTTTTILPWCYSGMTTDWPQWHMNIPCGGVFTNMKKNRGRSVHRRVKGIISCCSEHVMCGFKAWFSKILKNLTTGIFFLSCASKQNLLQQIILKKTSIWPICAKTLPKLLTTCISVLYCCCFLASLLRGRRGAEVKGRIRKRYCASPHQ